MLLGPTASGKSGLAMVLAERFALEIISVDSAQVYRGMDIGTAKPEAGERARVVHHLVDIRDPADTYNAASFALDARRLIDEIAARGRLPLLVGGTMLYARALRSPFDALPPADPALRARIDADALAIGWPALHARLAALDPPTAARLDPADSQRIQRALEVIEITGQPLSRLQGTRPGHAPLAIDVVSLEPSNRAWLHERIAQRFEQMLEQGLLEEVARLRARGDLQAALPSMRAVGYRQAWECLEGTRPIATLRDTGIAATRQLAKRQLTWLRSMDVARRFDCIDAQTPARVIALVDAHLNGHPPGGTT